MKTLMKLCFASPLLLTLVVPALASVTVNSPSNGAEVGSPFTVSATSVSCSAQNVSAVGYSLDGSPDTVTVNGTSLQTAVAASAGAHTLHVKSWGEAGSACVTDVTITVSDPSSNSIVPSNASNVTYLQALGNWKSTNDSGAKGNSSGWMGLINSPSLSGSARKFVTTYEDNGDERYQVSFGDDEYATNFFYDAWVYIANSSANIGNLEMDMNQVMSNGQTVIYGVQCDGWSGTWDYTANTGTPSHWKDSWLHSNVPCNPRKWSINTWHHVQVYYSRDDSGVVSYHYVTFDGDQQWINATVPSSFALGWGATLLTNFQVDGVGANGTNTVLLDQLAIYRW